jgi:hypothetical protein
MKTLIENEYFRIWVGGSYYWGIQKYPDFKAIYLGYLNISLYN